jgi:predicted ArsR family transcriptional regulator
MDVPPLPGDDPLGGETPRALFALLGELGRTASTEELATALDLHPNGIRRHLEQLHLGGLIRRDSIRRGRGRPRAGWSIDPDARPGGDQPRGYEELGRWLARAVSAEPDSLRHIEQTGRAIGRELPSSQAGVAPTGEPGLGDFKRAVTWLGFAPQLEPEGPGDHDPVTVRLTNCPYRQAVQENAPVICTLHKGILSGLLETLEPGTAIDGFTPRDPATAGCVVQLRRSGPDGGAPSGA